MASTSGTTTPFFGCKISLISKSEIRYEGILYTIDPKESTIALAKVRSFGSEERPVERYVPPRDDIFEFIIFRASDIKDLIVDEPPQTLQPTLADPAIIQAQHSASTSFPTAFSQSTSGTAQQGQQTALEKLQQKAAKGSGAIPKKHSADTQGDSKTTSKSSSSSGASGQNAQPKQSSSGRQQSLHFTNKQTHQPRLEQQQQQQQQGGGNAHHNQHIGPRGYGPRLHRQNGFMENLMMGEHGGNSNNFHRGGPQQNFHQHGGNRFSPRPDNQQHGGGFGGRGGGGGGFRRGGFTGGPGTIGQRKFVPRPISHPTAVKFPPLPDGDFDFEKAQEDFKLLEEKLNALKMNGPLPGTSESGDEAPVAEIPEIPGVPAAAIAVAVLEEEANPKEPCYDKTKSFFDSISCQALEREKGNNQRIDWKVERKLNRETFGVVSARRPGFYRANNRGGGFGGPNYNQGIRAAN